MPAHALNTLFQHLDNAARQAGRPSPRLLAVSKHHPADAVAALATALGSLAGDRARQTQAFGENYVQEARRKRDELADIDDIEWHLIGPLQSNKARLAAQRFAWIETIDRLPVAVEALHPGPLRPLERELATWE